ncbi:uncharacterized protein N7500_009988 [Penicillium coprophilum]|uniref:uncharacterized protein n=1 Tax=Penicillium coprophilum TaxID=36646 RepID=UPI0023A50D5F|nr:uncharacterized protein N7500_009988 [Penicillium coprophilum]KAJ5154549.1 hypothetical protein N7500_009988 [Penicillium coprophilum]
MQGLIHRWSKPTILAAHLDILDTIIWEIKHSHSFHHAPAPIRPACLDTAKLFSGSDGNITQFTSDADFLTPTRNGLRKALVGGGPSERRKWFQVAGHLGNQARLVESVDKCLQ